MIFFYKFFFFFILIEFSILLHDGGWIESAGLALIHRLTAPYSFGCRLYIEQFGDDTSKHGQDAQEALKPIIDLALSLSKLTELTGREKPTVIT
jgi:hypothetical protein